MQSCDPQQVIEEARRWIGTPFRHQWSRRGRGCDCVGLIRGVAENLGLVIITSDLRPALESYSRTPNPNHMGELLEHFMERSPIDRAAAAPDAHVAWLEWREDLPMHLAITATFDGRQTLIHAVARNGAVAEHGFSGEWRRRVYSYWRFPGVAY